ncbi:hypothetical protein AB0I75_34355 [Streptomyces sp. NPDC050273]|uniref:hypothetical protein n=1 Tax=Streptomyces sp. NPDC050273 TaxID=3154933 RepID=UPI00344198D2
MRLTLAESRWTGHDTLIEQLIHPAGGIALNEDMLPCACACACACAFGERSCRA